MDLNQRKKELKSELPKMGIPYIIKALKLIVPSGVAKHNMLINFESEYDEWEVKRMKGTVTAEQFGTAKADIRDRLLLFIDRLEESDLKKTVLKDKEAQKTLHKKGSLLYQIPKRMQVLQPSECVVRIAFDEPLLMENLEYVDETKVESLKRVTNRMKVEMVDASDDNFEIRAISDTIQAIHEEDFTEWEFLVKPLREGTHTLRIKATTMILVDGIETPHEKVFKKKIDITAEEVIPEAASFEMVDDNYSYYSPESISTTVTSGVRLPKGIRTMAMGLLALIVTSTASYAFVPAVILVSHAYLKGVF